MLPLFTGEDRGERWLKISGRIPVDSFWSQDPKTRKNIQAIFRLIKYSFGIPFVG
jgi:hypothetical protein